MARLSPCSEPVSTSQGSTLDAGQQTTGQKAVAHDRAGLPSLTKKKHDIGSQLASTLVSPPFCSRAARCSIVELFAIIADCGAFSGIADLARYARTARLTP